MAGVLVVAIAAAAILYLLVVPGMLSSSYKERAEPEHNDIGLALNAVLFTFSRETFGGDPSEVQRAKRPATYIRAVERLTRRELSDLTRARRAIKQARRELDDIDANEITDAPDWPLLGGRGDLADVESIAASGADYLGRARRFLRDYSLLVNWWSDLVRFARRYAFTFGRALGDIPRNARTPAEYTRPIDRGVSELGSQVERFERRRAPAPVRAVQRNQAAAVRFVISELRGLSSAVKRFDMARFEQFERRFTRGARRYDRRANANFRELIGRSTYARQIKRLRQTDRRLSKAIDEL